MKVWKQGYRNECEKKKQRNRNGMPGKTELRAAVADPNQQSPDQPDEKRRPGNAPGADADAGRRRLNRSGAQEENGDTERNKNALTPPCNHFIHVSWDMEGHSMKCNGIRSKARRGEWSQFRRPPVPRLRKPPKTVRVRIFISRQIDQLPM